MAKQVDHTAWQVLPHDPPEALAPEVWRVVGTVPGMALRRCMIVVRLADGDLLLHSAIALDEAGMAWLEGLGRPRWLLVPNGWHRLDAARYLARYPDIQVVCPPGARKKVSERVPVAYRWQEAPLPAGPVRLEVLDGLRGVEGTVIVEGPEGATLVFTDALFNLPHGHGFFWWFYGRVLRNAGGPKVTTIARMFVVKDKAAYRAHLERLATIPDLRRIVPGHGDVITGDAAATLRQVASTL